jgi:TRAP-type transport system large permease protein
MSASFRYLLPFIGVMAVIMFLLILFPGLMTLMSLGM